MMSLSRLSSAALVFFLFVPALASATPIVDRGVQSFLAQSLFVDIAAETAALDFDAQDFVVSYLGTTSGSVWNGSFSGNMLGGPLDGSMGGHIDAPTSSDPTMTIENGSLRLRGQTPYTLNGSFTWDETTGVASSLVMTLELGGRNPPVTWRNSGNLTYSFKAGNVSNLTGTITSGGNMYRIDISFTPGDIRRRESPGTISSTLTPVNGGAAVTNTGSGTLGFFSTFDGSMDLDATSIPEPSTVTLLAAGGLAIGWRRRRTWLAVDKSRSDSTAR
jgi:hypothetical protein